MPFCRIEDFQRIDDFTIHRLGISASLLMENAGNEMGRIIYEEAQGRPVLMVCGRGNNGGDALTAARWIKKNYADYPLRIAVEGTKSSRRSDLFNEKFSLLKHFHREICFVPGVSRRFIRHIKEAGCIVDGLFGTGLNRPVSGECADILSICSSACHAKKIALDIPSGLAHHGDGAVFHADLTLTVHMLKDLFLYPWYAAFTGDIRIIPIDFPKKITVPYIRQIFDIPAVETSSSPQSEKKKLNKRIKKNSFINKLSFGRSVVIAGSQKYRGAVLLSLRGTLSAGSRYCSVLSPIPLDAASFPQVLYLDGIKTPALGMLHFRQYETELAAMRWILFGPGVDRRPETTEFLEALLLRIGKKNEQGAARPCIIIDADGLYHLRLLMQQVKTAAVLRKLTVCITPHTGEFSQFSGITIPELKRFFFAELQRYSRQYSLRIILKDAFIFYASGGSIARFPYTNEYLAKAGSGDILAGMLLGMLPEAAHNAEFSSENPFCGGSPPDYDRIDYGILQVLQYWVQHAAHIRNTARGNESITRLLGPEGTAIHCRT